MAALIIGLVVFLGAHLVPSVPSLRAAAGRQLGEKGYRGLFSLVSLLGLGLIVWGKSQAPFVHVFSPPLWGRHATMSLMALACYCLASMYLPGGVKRWTAHPMLWGVSLWGVGHLLANGDLASLLLFGGFLAFGLFDIRSANRRGARPAHPPLSVRTEVLIVGLSLVLYGGLLWVHPHAFGVPVLRG